MDADRHWPFPLNGGEMRTHATHDCEMDEPQKDDNSSNSWKGG